MLTRTDFTQDTGGVLLSALNVIPTSRQDPNAVKLLGLYPAATASGLANDFQGYVPTEDKNTNTYDIRIDANISPKNILFGVYDRSYLTADVPSYFPGVGAGQSGGRVDQLARLGLGGRLHAHPHSHAHQRHARRHGPQRQAAGIRLGQ